MGWILQLINRSRSFIAARLHTSGCKGKKLWYCYSRSIGDWNIKCYYWIYFAIYIKPDDTLDAFFFCSPFCKCDCHLANR